MKKFFNRILWLIVILPPLAGVIALPFSIPVGALIILPWCVIGLPIGILKGIDWYETSKSTSGPAVAARMMMAVFILLFGALCFLAGAGVICWMIYIILWPQPDRPRGEVVYLTLPVLFMIFGGYLVKIGWSRKSIAKDPPPNAEP